MSATALHLIGVDGGATGVKAHQVFVLQDGPQPLLALGPASAEHCYDRVPGFEPVELARQVRDADSGRVRPTRAEREQGRTWVEAAAQAIEAVASQTGAGPLAIGMCMPGLKTRDGRGIAVLNNGPRLPAYLDELEQELRARELVLARPIAGLVSDGVACALGEQHEAHGALRGVAQACYIGGGTGVAEAFVLDGAVVALDALAPGVRKAWELTSRRGGSFESWISLHGLNSRHAERAGFAFDDPDGYPERRAPAGERLAQESLGECADALAELLCLRFVEFRRVFGADARGARGVRANTLFERVVIGQRLGPLFSDPLLEPFLRERCEVALAQALAAHGDAQLCAHYLDGSGLRPGLLCPSLLRAAPALGAAGLALREDQRPDARRLEAQA